MSLLKIAVEKLPLEKGNEENDKPVKLKVTFCYTKTNKFKVGFTSGTRNEKKTK